MSTSFLPAINTKDSGFNNTNGTHALVPLNQMTGMSGVRTGESFQKKSGTRNKFNLRTGRVSPIRSASITDLLSPKEIIQEFTRKGSQDFGIAGYNMPKSGSPLKTSKATINKNKTPGPIEAEAKYRRNFPGAGAYTLPHDLPWDEQFKAMQKRPNMNKAPRLTMGDEVAAMVKKGIATPSPNDYDVNKDYTLPNVSKGGGSLLQA